MIKETVLTREMLEWLKQEYQNDIHFDWMTSEDSEDGEYWIGENGTTPMMIALWYGDDEGMCRLIWLGGVTAQQLRQDRDFLAAWVANEDVNHSMSCTDGISRESLEQYFRWQTGKTDTVPVTPCGLVNYIDENDRYKELPKDKIARYFQAMYAAEVEAFSDPQETRIIVETDIEDVEARWWTKEGKCIRSFLYYMIDGSQMYSNALEGHWQVTSSEGGWAGPMINPKAVLRWLTHLILDNPHVTEIYAEGY